MGTWHSTGCVLCAQNCGLKVLVENGKMVKVVPDKENPRSRGYACRKGLRILYHQYQKDRLLTPLKKVDGKFIKISWDRALDEISQKLKGIIEKHSPRSFAYIGGSSQGGHMEAGFGLSLLRGLGSQYYYSSAGQEFSGYWWVTGRVVGKQYNINIPDESESEMLIAWGWNGMESHQMPRAPLVLKEFSKDKNKILVSIDPRRSETADIANIHIPLRPGSDALLIKAMIALILYKNGENRKYLRDMVSGWDQVKPWFENFDYKKSIEACGVSFNSVSELCDLLISKKWSFHCDLGIFMGRHSTLSSYLLYILGAVCGIYQTRGGNMIPGMVMPMGFHADERDEKIWRTVETKMPPAAAGSYPPSVLPEEILSNNPKRLRALYITACNPLRAYPDTKAYEKAFEKLDLVVVSDIVMSETALLADYVLPCRSFYESWDTTFFPWTYPEVYMQLRSPVIKPPPECLEASQIHTELADRMDLIPEIPENLYKAAEKDRMFFAGELMKWAASEPRALKAMPFVLAKTLGKNWDSAAKAGLWGLLMTAPEKFRKNAKRAGFEDGIDLGDRIFEKLLDIKEGFWVGVADTLNPIDDIKTESGKLEIHIPELAQQAKNLNWEDEEKDLTLSSDFPMILSAGYHSKYTMNSLMRNPEWNKGKRDCTIGLNPADARMLKIDDGQMVKISTENGSETGEAEISERIAKGTVLIPHGFGQVYDGIKYGININRLTKNKNRDPIGTPIHRYVPCRVERTTQ